MLKKIIEKIVTGEKAHVYSSANFDEKIDGYLLIASPEDLIELVADRTAVPSPVLKKIIISAINRLEEDSNQEFS